MMFLGCGGVGGRRIQKLLREIKSYCDLLMSYPYLIKICQIWSGKNMQDYFGKKGSHGRQISNSKWGFSVLIQHGLGLFLLICF